MDPDPAPGALSGAGAAVTMSPAASASEPHGRLRQVRPGVVIAAVALAAFLSRTVWLPWAPLTPDPVATLWMGMDAVREGFLPDHGLVSSYRAFQPPGLVWLTMPFLAVSGGRPEVTMIAFGLLNAAAIGFLLLVVARRWGVWAALAAGVFFVAGPDVYMSPMVWHPSLFTAATCVLLGCALRLRGGSPWWALPMLAVPGLYALVHYSGLALYGPAVALALYSRRPWRTLVLPAVAAAAVTVVAWLPFLTFEAARNWVDLTTIVHAADQEGGLLGKLEGRARGAVQAVLHLGQGWHGVVLLTPVLVGLPVLALALCWRRHRLPEAVVVPVVCVVSGVAVQVAANMGSRFDVLLLWLPALYLLAGWLIAQVPVRPLRVVVLVVVLLLGATSVINSVMDSDQSQTLRSQQAAADAGRQPTYEDLFQLNSIYLPCDPPYTWGVETWYLMEADDPGSGVRAATRAGAFRDRTGPCRWR